MKTRQITVDAYTMPGSALDTGQKWDSPLVKGTIGKSQLSQ